MLRTNNRALREITRAIRRRIYELARENVELTETFMDLDTASKKIGDTVYVDSAQAIA